MGFERGGAQDRHRGSQPVFIFIDLRVLTIDPHVRAIHGTGEPFTGLGRGAKVVLEQHLGEG
jgi:hypothetical protein